MRFYLIIELNVCQWEDDELFVTLMSESEKRYYNLVIRECKLFILHSLFQNPVMLHLFLYPHVEDLLSMK